MSAKESAKPVGNVGEHGVLNRVTMGDQTVYRPEGGETHQIAEGMASLNMTTEQGIPVSDDQNSLRAGPRGPLLMEDFKFREKLFHFDHERIPERVVHAHGISAHGYFETYESLSDITCADLFQRAGEKTETFVRFSPATGSRGSVDVARDVRGFAVKFYTKEGNWDLVGNHIPVFFIQDAIKFPDLVHALKEEPDTGFPQAQTAHDNFWDFASLNPETFHMNMWIMSDHGIPRSLRFMNGFGVHTFRMVNKNGKATFVKFHWKAKLGLQSFTWHEAMRINGADPDFHRRDLWQAIQSGAYPEWELGLQLFDEEFANKFDFDVLDSTKIIPEEECPLRIVGKLVLNRWVDNTFAENEQVAYCIQNIVPGIEFTNDPLLQGRLFSYLDTQLKRLGGPNFTEIPINRTRGCPVHNFQQDGHMKINNIKGRANYEPNSWGGPQPRENPYTGFRTYPDDVSGQKCRRRPESFNDHYSQARQFWISQTRVEKQHIIEGYSFELSKVKTSAIRARVVGHLRNIDHGLAVAVARNLGLKEFPAAIQAMQPTRQDLKPTRSVSIVLNSPGFMTGRKLGILVTEGADATVLNAFNALATPEGVIIEYISPNVEGFVDSGGSTRIGNENYEGGISPLYDAVAIVVSESKAKEISMDLMARDFVMSAFMHCKFIAYTEHALPLIKSSGVDPEKDGGMMKVSGITDCTEFMALGRKFLRFWERGNLVPETA